MSESCSNCKFWTDFDKTTEEEREASPHHGYCRRYPKQLSQYSHWWCGEWKQNEVSNGTP